MNKPQKQVVLTLSRGARELLYHLKRLEGVQGPERRLVEESRSDGEQVGAEERKERSDCSEEGRRVEEIVKLAELRRYVERARLQARMSEDAAQTSDDWESETLYKGKKIALDELRDHFERIAEKRSDLFNDKDLARRALDSE